MGGEGRQVKFPYPPKTMALIMDWRADNMEPDPGKTILPKMPKPMSKKYKKIAIDETFEMARDSGDRSLLETVEGWTSKQWGYDTKVFVKMLEIASRTRTAEKYHQNFNVSRVDVFLDLVPVNCFVTSAL